MNLGTPAILFSAIALIMLAYTNRFFVLAKLIRDIHSDRGNRPDLQVKQIPNLRRRLSLIKTMQALGVIAFILCTLSMQLIYMDHADVGAQVFMLAVFTLMGSLVISLWEVMISTKALDIVLADRENEG
ncbi:DUF2721 domain-containing protein [Paraferrimonas sedimenticola]|uniref:Membrane protein n=1 Tax=Paraferrimonas sedimenticola TaxID=375674 RepID=A0AA37W223_9GAMM|nr:DUF2721 domain-containing protein [Paraferrimonas sedimenticola]GLP97182.1 membrane protein [Paraferrimonas sedimenticola]